MDERLWYSVRMRAEADGRHLSGGECLVPSPQAMDAVNRLLERVVRRPEVEKVTVTLDAVFPRRLRSVKALRVRTLRFRSVASSRARAAEILTAWGVGRVAVARAFDLLTNGANPKGGNMRGAILMDGATGRRLEPDPERGVRVSFVDFEPDSRETFVARFRGKRAERFRDAYALAAKVASVLGVVAELCWSDDPDYTTGYVASREGGYVRLSHLKPEGVALGGRVYFVDVSSFSLARDVAYLESAPTLVTIDSDALFEEA
jgi:6-carboxyhexanoate--CoA ligase